MVEPVKGFQTADGTFFKSYPEAQYYEKRLQLYARCQRSIQITVQNAPAFLDFIESNPELVISFAVAAERLQEYNETVINSEKVELEEMNKGVAFDVPDKEQAKTKK